MRSVVSLLFHDIYVSQPSESGFRSPAADRYKLTTAEFEMQLACLAGTQQCAPLSPCDLLDTLTAKPGPTERTTRNFFVTSDDGGRSYYTETANRLDARGWRGACFVSTDFIGRPEFLSRQHIRELDARGHLIGSHSASHPMRFSACTRAQMNAEWTRSRGVLEDLLGHSVTTASLPGGYFSTDVARAAADSGIRLLFTSEPATRVRSVDGCVVVGRFTIRAGARFNLAQALVSSSPWTRLSAWTSWNAKGLIKPLLGSSYPVIADLLLARKAHQ